MSTFNWQSLLKRGKEALRGDSIEIVRDWRGDSDPDILIRSNGLVLQLQEFDGYDYHAPHLVNVMDQLGRCIGKKRCNYRLSNGEWNSLSRRIEDALLRFRALPTPAKDGDEA